MKKIFLLLTAIFSLIIAKGQVIQVGYLTSDFYHVTYSPIYKIQDTNIDDMAYTLPIDIDGDGVHDLSLISAYNRSSFQDYYYPVWWCGLSLNSQTDIIRIKGGYADTLNKGDIISNENDWYHGNLLFCNNINNFTLDSTWKNSQTHYVGLRIRKITGDTLFGWLSINVKGYHTIFLKETACQSQNPGDTIITFHTPENVDTTSTIEYREYKIFPNPFSSSAILQADSIFHDATISIYNYSGQMVEQIYNVNDQTITLYRKNLPVGLYIVRLTEEDRTFTIGEFVISDQ